MYQVFAAKMRQGFAAKMYQGDGETPVNRVSSLPKKGKEREDAKQEKEKHGNPSDPTSFAQWSQ